MPKEKRFFIICLVIGIMFIVLVIGVLNYLYYYERDYMAQGPSKGIYLDDWKTKHIEIYRDKYFGYASEEIKKPDPDKKKIPLSDEDRQVIRNIINDNDDKSVQPYRRLWYRYDATIVYDDKILCKVDLKNRIVFIEEFVAHTISDKTEDLEQLRGCFFLTEEENKILKDIIMGERK